MNRNQNSDFHLINLTASSVFQIESLVGNVSLSQKEQELDHRLDS